mmetsp:Transcript_12455/g.15002  ORF Transcript_12455/g.15002 Transcript_12455/m.15002 type:complete len:551 (+) Transcript_12455:138-1790(+)|eukprot:CAMPEP_0114377156 /NCGR_PEP_ID=MMETSP0102-20121206/825_1 /TAXON_ID=38822 ORGANISM="Pteridomonas danica, Strain PT" /NCGR_SAMPLE_ID=MMETSP0102 /ASSEMBLY_ACC=CAM_ASM_000212 /LENGTH=550 /DNA_ID=CAMNT_0001531671 /DNA_START=262 /DNA_END=1914 /DNA_ORIENTATION=-
MPSTSSYLPTNGLDPNALSLPVENQINTETEGVSCHKLTVDEALAKVGTGKFQYILLLIAGLAFSGDAIEVSLLTFLSPCVQNNWDLSNIDTASLASAVFGGAMVGSVILGAGADIYGRRPMYFVSCWLVLFFGICSCVAWNYQTLLFTRAMVGVGIGGITSPFNLLAELLQPCERGQYLMYIEYFWTLGSIYCTLVAYFMLSSYGWRVLTAFCALPVTLSLAAGIWLPESPRWLLLQNRPEEAKQVIMRMARINKTEPNLPQTWDLECISSSVQSESKPSFQDKLKKPLEVFSTRALSIRTLLVWTVWFMFGICYYGLILLISRVYDIGETDDGQSSSKCSFHSLSVVFASSAEVVGLTVIVFTIDSLGRRGSQAGFLLIAALGTFFLGLVSSASLVSVFAFFARGASMGASAVTWVAVPELYPTKLRATGHSLANTMARLGAFVSPFIVDSTLSIFHVALIFAIANMISFTSVLMLPETAGISLDMLEEPQSQVRNVLPSQSDMDDSQRGSEQEPSINGDGSILANDTYNPIADSVESRSSFDSVDVT